MILDAFLLLVFLWLGEIVLECHGSEDSAPILGRSTIGFQHASYLSPNYEFEKGFREALSSPAGGLCLQSPLVCDPENPFRSFDGSCNNLKQPHMGKAKLPYRRILPPGISEDDNFQCRNNNGSLPSPRSVSLHLVRRGEEDQSPDLSMYVMLWGQLIDHDMLITPLRMTGRGEFLDCCHPLNSDHKDCCVVRSSDDDPFFKPEHRPKCQSILRSNLVRDETCLKSDIENGNTAWIDGSIIYGSTEERANLLRKFEGGRLRVSVDRRSRHFPPISSKNGISMEFGDVRGDSTWGTTLVTTALIRYHNALANALFAMNTEWSDEKIFQETRKIVIAFIQHFTYSHFLPNVIGSPNNLQISSSAAGHQDSYDPSVDGRIFLEFADAGFRLHTLIGSSFSLVDNNYRMQSKVLLRDAFRNSIRLMINDTFDQLMRGLAVTPLHTFNNVYSPEMTEWMFRRGSEDFGLDIIAITIQRGRDHRLPGYIRYREACGLGKVKSWNDLIDFIPVEIVRRLRRLYRSFEDIDADAGMILETSTPGTEVGPTIHCIIRNQFQNIRNGDRFFYTRPEVFTSLQLRSIKQMRLSDLLCAVADDKETMALPNSIFHIANPVRNPVKRCSQHRRFNIGPWRER